MPLTSRSDPPGLDDAIRDLEERWRRGERPLAEEFLLQYPEIAATPEAILDLIYAEHLAREAAGLSIADAHYHTRFPTLAGQLADLLELHQTLIAPGRATLTAPAAVSLPSRYRDPKEVGRGGMAVVYRAVDQVLERTVAVKVLFPNPADPDRISRLAREALVLARTAHPGIVQVFDVCEHEGTAFLVMEYVSGGTLRDRLKAGLMPTGEAAELVRKLADAVAAAHQERVVHRDLKPSNVLLSAPDGAVKLSDFGLAKLLDEAASQSGMLTGTVEYVSPEQSVGTRTVGPPSDVYSLGVILYECLVGRTPYAGVTLLDILHQLAESEPVAPSRLRFGVPPDLEAVCLKCLEKDPGRRYPTATELAADLARFLAGQPTAARPASVTSRIVRRVRRNPMLATFSLVTGLALAAGVAGIAWQWQRAERANADLKDALEAELAQRRVSEQLLYNATISQAVICWESGEVRKAREELSTAIPKAGRDDLRGWEWYYLDRLFRPELAVLPCEHWVNGIAALGESQFAVAIGRPRYNQFQTPTPSDGRTGYLSWPADGPPVAQLRPGPTPTAGVACLAVDTVGKRVAWGTVDGRVVLSEAGTQRLIHAWDLGSDVTSVSFALGGKSLVAGCSDGSAWVIAVSGDSDSSPVRHTVWKSVACHVHAAPDGKRVVCYGGSSGLRVYSIPDWNLVGEWSKSEGQILAASFTLDGSLVTGGANGRVAVWNGTSGAPVAAWEAHAGPIYALAVREGGVLASAGSDCVIRLWALTDGKPLGLLRGHTSSVRSLCFGTDPHSLASGGQDGTARFWDTAHNPRGRLLPFHYRLNNASVAMENDQMIVRAIALDGVVRNWAVTGRGEVRHDVSLNIASQKHYPVAYTAFLSEGRFVAGIPADNPNTVAVWESATGREAFRAPPGSGRVLTLATDCRGRRLVWASSAAGGIELRTWVPGGDGAPSAPTFVRGASARAVATTTDGRGVAAVVRPQAGEPNTVWLRGPTGQSSAPIAQGAGSSGGLAFSPGGEFLAASLDDDVQVFRSDTGEAVSTSAAVGAATCIAFSPDGRRMATVGYDGVVSLIIPNSGKVVFQLRGLAPRRHNDFASDARVVFSPDGQSLISTNWNGSINVWNAAILSNTRPSLPEG